MRACRLPAALAASLAATVLVLSLAVAGPLPGQIPFHQDKVPNKPYPPEVALTKMRVPDGFTVELVAAEPDIVNPIAMAFDEKGRIWITESLEYPRKSAGKGRDRVKVLQDTDRDGKVDKVTVFAKGLNIPSGIAVGYGGVFVANSPDLLFLSDTDGDLVADKTEVIATGFGRDDTHELPNSLTWGPDGYLYGLNGVFNRSRVTQDLDADGKPDGGKTFRFTCAMFRIDPRTRRFSIFCEGTSNPWGIAFDENGSAFVSACVIDHLWHLLETGYYHRQGGPYPPFTWKLGSIVEHTHQKAAYCGITWFDSDAYPEEYRGALYMGNIHGNCINSDVARPRGSSYFATPRPDFLSVDDAWFMPVAQKTGPDGCLYVLDWYDRYHCYQDANRDPEGIDRGKGRLYRIRYGVKKGGSPRAPGFDLAAETDAQLTSRLGSPNVFFRRTAQRLLAERLWRTRRDGTGQEPVHPTRRALEKLTYASADRKTRLHAVWTQVATGRLSPRIHERLLYHDDPTFRAWAVRAAGNFVDVDVAIRATIARMAVDPSPEVRVQVAIAAGKIRGLDPLAILADVLAHTDDDEVLPHIVWQNLHPLLVGDARRFLSLAEAHGLHRDSALARLLPRVSERLLASMSRAAHPTADDLQALLQLFGHVLDRDSDAARRCLAALSSVIQSGELPKAHSNQLRDQLVAKLDRVLTAHRDRTIFVDAALLSASWGQERGCQMVRAIAADRTRPPSTRLRALDTLVSSRPSAALDLSREILSREILGAAAESQDFSTDVLAALGRLDDADVAELALSIYPKLAARFRPKIIDLLTQRASWSRRLVDAVAAGDIDATAVHGTQVRNLHHQFSSPRTDEKMLSRLRKLWGTVRSSRNPDREKTIARVRSLLTVREGDPKKGREVFTTACALCHKIHGQGAAFGPDLTGNGRGTFEQLLTSVLDPNLVVGEAYQLRSVVTHEGRVVSGMLEEQSERRVVVRTVGGKPETIASKDVKEILESPLSFMPEGLEHTMTQDQLVDLFAFLTLDLPPENANTRPIPGFAPLRPRSTDRPGEFDALLATVAPGFHVRASGVGGVALLAEHLGRPCVVRTHPISRTRPCVLEGTVTLPVAGTAALEVSVAHHEPGTGTRNWQLVVKANGHTIHDSLIGRRASAKSDDPGWVDLSIDLSAYAGKRLHLELLNKANDWIYEYGYWGRVALVTNARPPREKRKK